MTSYAFQTICPDCEEERTVRLCRQPSPDLRCRPCALEIRRLAGADIDEIAVRRLISGEPPQTTTRAERQSAVAYFTGKGWSAKRIGDRIGVTERTVQRLRAQEARNLQQTG